MVCVLLNGGSMNERRVHLVKGIRKIKCKLGKHRPSIDIINDAEKVKCYYCNKELKVLTPRIEKFKKEVSEW